MAVDELEDISQYQVMMTVDPQAVAGSHIATKFASERRRKRHSDGRERSPRPKKRSWNKTQPKKDVEPRAQSKQA